MAFTALPENRRGLTDMFLMTLRSSMAIIGSRIVLNVRRSLSVKSLPFSRRNPNSEYHQNAIQARAHKQNLITREYSETQCVERHVN